MSILKRFTGVTALAVAVGLLAATPAHAASAAAVHHPTTIAPGSLRDPNLHFAGRWDRSDPTTYVGNWESPYVETGFTGTTAKATIRDAATVYASIDHGPVATFSGVSGTIDLTPTPLADGEHSVLLTYRTGELDTCAIWPSPCATFQGFTFDQGARTLPLPPRRKVVEFVGDSITVGALSSKNTVTSYSWLTGEQLGADHTNIARSGACLVQLSNCFGIGASFGKQTIGGTTDWDFSRYTADAVVINLGTNDAGRGVSGPDFQAAYVDLLRQARAKYPHAALFAFETFRQRYLAETQAAVQTLTDAGDANVFYINTEGWLTDADYVDGGHPNDGGHAKIAQRLAPILAPHIGVPLPGTPADRNIDFVGRWDTTNPAAVVPQWAGAYLRVGFTGTTVTLQQRRTIDFWYSLDGGPYTLVPGISGPVPLPALPAGRHTLLVSYRIVAGSYTGDAVFQGLTLDAGERTYRLPRPRQATEWIGDSITAGYTATNVSLSSFPWIISENLGVTHTQIALSGSCLRELSATESIRGIRCFGLEDRYTKLGFQDGAADWDFRKYQPDVVVINIGTNDVGHGVASADFRTAYEHLLRIVREKNPHAVILARRIFKGWWATETQQAVLNRQAAGDDNISYVDTTGWWDPTTMTNDGTHPNDHGHQVLAGYLQPFVAAALERCKGAHA
jgi:lysophospholipase L1-like esterase